MRYYLFLTLLLAGFLPRLTHAHFGHLGELAGHSHWGAVAGVAVAVAGAVLWGRLKAAANQDDDAAEAPNTDDAEEGEEANV